MGLQVWLPLTSAEIINKGTNGNTFSGSNISYTTSGKISSAVLLNGSNAYVYGNVDLTDEMTFACWVKFNGSNAYHIIDCRATSGETGYQPMYGGPGYGLQVFNSYDGVGYTWDNSICNFTSGVWYHLIVIYKPTHCELYINGVKKGSNSTTCYGTNTHGTRQMRIGTRCSGANWLNGIVNDVRVYDHALSNIEIKNLSRALVLHYNFEDFYKPLDYIEFSGGQYINTGMQFLGAYIDGSLPVIIEADVTPQDSSGINLCLAGCGNSQWNGPVMMNLCNNKMEFGTGGYEVAGVYTPNQRTTFKMELNMYSQYYYKDGELYYNSNSTKSFVSSNYPLYIGNFNAAGSVNAAGVGYKGKLHSFKVSWGMETRDFIPVMRNVDGKIGLYDKVYGQFFTNSGYSDFTYNECFGAINTSNASVSRTTVTFNAKSSDGWGNCGITSKYNFDRGYVAATVGQNNRYIMIGVASINTSYDYTQGYFIYPSNNGTYNIYEMGTHIGNFGSYSANDRFKVIYDGSKVSYYKNDSLVREVAVSGKMYMNITNYDAAAAVITDVCFGKLDMIKDVSGNNHFARLQTPTAFSRTTDSKIGEFALRNVSGDSNARINTTLNPSFISSGTICFWYKKDSSAFNYNSGHFLVATQNSNGYFFGATADSLPFNSGCSYGTFYLDGVASSNSNIQDTNWHFYAFTGVSLTSWTSFSMQAHGDTSWLWRGNIADFKIYNTSLSASDIKDLYETRAKIDNKGNVYCEKLIDLSNDVQLPNDKGLIKANSFSISNEAQIRNDYERLEYIYSTGSQQIDTGVKFNMNSDSCEVDFQANVSNHNGMIFASPSSTNHFWFYHYYDSRKIDLYIKNGGSQAGYNGTVVDVLRHKMVYRNKVYYLDGSKMGEDTRTLNTTDGNIFLFSYGGGVYYNGKMYSCKIWKSDILVRDFIPARRKSDGSIGMLDLVENKFYTSTSGTFYTFNQVEYIQSSGTQYIDTGHKISSEKMKVEFNYCFPNGMNGLSLFGSNGSVYDLVPYSSSSYGSGVFRHWVGSSSGIMDLQYYTSTSQKNYAMYMLKNGYIYGSARNIASTSYNGSLQSGQNFYIFGKNGNGTSAERANGYRLYDFKLHDNDVIVRNFIPAKRSDGVIGMFDKLYKIFYTNSGSGTFTCGSEVSSSEFKKTNMSQVIGNNIYEGMGASVSPIIQKINDSYTYTLSISAATGSTLTINRTSSNYGATGVLSNGATLYDGDKLTISASASSGYNLSSLLVNSSSFSNGATHTVSGNVSVTTTTTVVVGWKTINSGTVLMEYQDIMTGIQGMGAVYSELFTTSDSSILSAMNTYTADKIRITGTAEFEEWNDPKSGTSSVLQTVSVSISNMLLSNGSVSATGTSTPTGSSYNASVTLKGYTTVTDYFGETHKGIANTTTKTSFDFKPMGTSVGTFTFKFARFRLTKVEAYY